MSPFADAWGRRAALHADEGTDCYRLFDGRFEGAPGWTIDRYADVAFVQRFVSEGVDPQGLDAFVSELDSRGLTVVFADRAGRAEAVVVSGELPAEGVEPRRPGRFAVRELGVRFGVDLLWGANTGLFLDARPLRAWVRAHADGRRILNLFSYTSAFGVSAMLGGARSVTNVDVVPSALERGRINYALNGLDGSRAHLKNDAFEVLRQARKRGQRFDGIVCDPPPLPTVGRKRGWDPKRDMGKLLSRARDVLSEDGWLLAVSAARPECFEGVLGEEREPLARGDDFPGPRAAGMRAWLL